MPSHSPVAVRTARLDDLLAVLGVHVQQGNRLPGVASERVEVVVVVARHRRQGIAREMLQRVLADARAAGCNKVQRLSHKRHALDGAHRLYTGLGFEPEAEGFRLYLQEAPVIVRAAKDP